MNSIFKTSLLLVILSSTLFAFMPSKYSGTVKAETEVKVIVLINHADWCLVCKANGARIQSDVMSKYADNPKYKLVVNNMTDKETIDASKTKCKEAGIDNFASKNKSTGTIFFIKNSDKTLISQISVAETSEKIIEAFDHSIYNQ